MNTIYIASVISYVCDSYTYKINLQIITNNILSPVSHVTHTSKSKASPFVSFSGPWGHLPHKKPKIYNDLALHAWLLAC